MFFERKDILVTYSVAFTAYNSLAEICRQRGIPRPFEDHEVFKEMGLQRKVSDAFRAPRNFLNHGERGKGTVKFFPAMAPFILLMGEEMVRALGHPATAECKVLNVWFALKYPKRSSGEMSQAIKNLTDEADPDDYSLFIELLKANK